MAIRPIFPGSIRSEAVELDSGDTTTAIDIFSAGSSGSRVDKIAITTDDSVAVDLDLFMHDGTSAFQLGTINVPAGAGVTALLPSVSFLNQTTLPFLGEDLALHLESGCKLQVAAQVTMTAAKVLHVAVFGGDY